MTETIAVNIYLAKNKTSTAKFLAKCFVTIIPDPPVPCAVIDFLDSDIVFFIKHLTQLIRRFHPSFQLFIERTNLHKFLGLDKYQVFRTSLDFDLLEKECHLQEKCGIQWVQPRLFTRPWNYSWYYSEQGEVDADHFSAGWTPAELRKGRDIGLLFLESLHRDPDLWTRVFGRYFISSEFYCYLDNFQCLCFCIDTSVPHIKILFKNYHGHWFQAPDIFSLAIWDCLPSCLSHLPFPSLKDLCLVTLLSKKSEQLFKLPLGFLQRQRVVQLHTLMNRFNLL